MRVHLRAFEVEHTGDVDGTKAALRDVGGTVVHTGQINYGEDSVALVVDFPQMTVNELNRLLDGAQWIGYIVKIV